MSARTRTPLKSPGSLARAIRSVLLLTVLGAVPSACVQAPPVYLTASDCRKLLPKSWSGGVPSAALPRDQTVGSWIAFGDAQTGQLDIANGRLETANEIQASCEEMLRKAGEAAQPKPWWAVF